MEIALSDLPLSPNPDYEFDGNEEALKKITAKTHTLLICSCILVLSVAKFVSLSIISLLTTATNAFSYSLIRIS